MLILISIATLVVGAVSLVGVFVVFRRGAAPKRMKAIISLAAGTLLGAAFLDLLPEAVEESGLEPHAMITVALTSFLVFFLFERAFHWHHCRDHDDEHTPPDSPQMAKKHIAFTNLFGDALHNLIDGFLIAAAFLIDVKTGLATTVAVILHEIPQEIADFGVLLYAGLSRTKALLFNFAIALTAVFGAVVFFYFSSRVRALIPIMAAFAAGNFIYLAAADLIPELHHENNPRRVIAHTVWLLIGVALIIVLGILLPHAE